MGPPSEHMSTVRDGSRRQLHTPVSGSSRRRIADLEACLVEHDEAGRWVTEILRPRGVSGVAGTGQGRERTPRTFCVQNLQMQAE